MPKTKTNAASVKIGMETKISFAISLAKIWQKEFRILTFNTLFNTAMNMNEAEFLKYCKLYGISTNQLSHDTVVKVDELIKEEEHDI